MTNDELVIPEALEKQIKERLKVAHLKFGWDREDIIDEMTAIVDEVLDELEI